MLTLGALFIHCTYQLLVSQTLENSAAVKPGRIQFIDVLRAFAILMMLQGHFVDTTLDPYYRQTDSWVYNLWHFMRGLTAPVFFTTTGLVFVYLLMKDGRIFWQNYRVKKGIRRGFFLVFLGYALKINLFGLLIGWFFESYLVVDVLHCIGLALVSLILLYGLHQLTRLPFGVLLLVSGLLVFLINPSFKAHDWSQWPTWAANYFTRTYGSVFTLVPWIGYTFIGGALGQLMHLRPQWAFSHWFPLAVLALGLLISTQTYEILTLGYQLTGWENFASVARSNGVFWRLGHVFVTVAIFIWGIGRVRTVPPLITKVGSETLTIYAAHYIVLFGTWFGIGINTFFTRSLGPWASAVGALLFVSSFVVLIYFIDDIRHWLYPRIDRVIDELRSPFRKIRQRLKKAED